MATQRNLRLIFCLAFLVISGSVVRLFSQTFSLSGVVKDSTGAILPGVTVTVVTKSGTTLTAITNDIGTYAFPSVPLDAVSVRVSLPGFAPSAQNVSPSEGAQTRLDFTIRTFLAAARPPGDRDPSPPPPDDGFAVTPTWNTWIDEWGEKPSFKPLEALKLDTDYMLAIDLSAFPYPGPGVKTKAASQELQKLLAESTKETELIQAIVLADPTYFQVTPDYIQEISIEMKKVRTALASGVAVNKTPFATLQTNPFPDFRFGWRTFRIHTGSQEGPASVAISLWVNHRKPVGEITLTTCISRDGKVSRKCKDRKPVQYSFKGVDDMRVVENPGDDLPDAALHLIELDPQTIMGLFRCNKCPGWGEDELRFWNVHMAAADFLNLYRAFLDQVGAASTPGDLTVYGKALYGDIFSNCRPNETSCEEARSTFEAFIEANLRPDLNDARRPATLFVRFVDHTGKPSMLLPLGLMVVPVKRGEEFVGRHIRVESPLEYQDYSAEETCLSNWIMLVPPETEGELAPARRQLQKTIGYWPDRVKQSDIREFERWISDEKARDTDPSVVMTFAHYDADAVFFRSTAKLRAGSIRRSLASPSVAILNGCGLFKPNGTQFIQNLNWRGVTAMIATSTDVDPLMAAGFFGILAESLKENSSNRSYRLGDAYYRAIRLLWNTKVKEGEDAEWGPRALIYSLVGNGALRLCTP